VGVNPIEAGKQGLRSTGRAFRAGEAPYNVTIAPAYPTTWSVFPLTAALVA
jgi:hypothetical protein